MKRKSYNVNMPRTAFPFFIVLGAVYAHSIIDLYMCDMSVTCLLVYRIWCVPAANLRIVEKSRILIDDNDVLYWWPSRHMHDNIPIPWLRKQQAWYLSLVKGHLSNAKVDSFMLFIHSINWCPYIYMDELESRHAYIIASIINTLRARRKCYHFANFILEYIFLNGDVWISLKVSLKFVPRVWISTIPAMF